MMTVGLGSKLIEEFGSVGAVLSADTGRLYRWLEEEGQAGWFIEQLSLKIKATSTLMKYTLAEEIKRPSNHQFMANTSRLSKDSHGKCQSIEQFRVLFLDKKNILIKDEILQKGTVDHTPSLST